MAGGRRADRSGGAQDHHVFAGLHLGYRGPLLRVDLPWWPLGLTDLDAILAWRPNDPVRTLKATHWDSGGASWLTRAADTGHESRCQHDSFVG
jgi:hypothetical protein